MLSIIGCGNLNRRDDAAGVAVIHKLLDHYGGRPPEGIQLFDAGTSGMEVMFQARGSDTLVIVDASHSGSDPGAIFEVPGHELEARPPPSYNLHDFRWDHALFAGRRIFADDFPNEVIVYLIEAADLDYGTGLSPKVEAAVERVLEKLLALIKG